jgi:hypothetical protein
MVLGLKLLRDFLAHLKNYADSEAQRQVKYQNKKREQNNSENRNACAKDGHRHLKDCLNNAEAKSANQRRYTVLSFRQEVQEAIVAQFNGDYFVVKEVRYPLGMGEYDDYVAKKVDGCAQDVA